MLAGCLKMSHGLVTQVNTIDSDDDNNDDHGEVCYTAL